MSPSIRTAAIRLAAVLFICVAPLFSYAYGPEVYTNLGLYGGQVLDIAADPSDPNKLFAACSLGDGLYVSTDGGQHWSPVVAAETITGEDTFKNHVVWDVAIAPGNPDIIWAAHDYWVEKSVDGGVTWRHIRNSSMQSTCSGCPPDDNFRICLAVAIDPHNPDVVYVGTGGPGGSETNGAIYKTVDGGDTWTKLGTVRDYDGNPLTDFHQPIYDIEIDPFSENIWVVTQSQSPWSGSLYWSNDGGNSWIVDTYANALFEDVTIKPHGSGTPSEVYIATAYGLLKNTYGLEMDGMKLELLEQSWLIGGWNYTRSVVFSANDSNIVYAAWHSPISWGGDGIGKMGRSSDGGDTWIISEPDEIFISLAVNPVDDTHVYAGHLNSGVFASTDSGGTWSAATEGITAVTIHDILVDPNDRGHVLAATKAGLYERSDSDQWNRLLKDDTWSVAMDPMDSLIVYAGIEGYVARTHDGGATWLRTEIPDYLAYNNISQIAVDPATADTLFIAVNYYGYGGAIHKSTDGGATFTSVLESYNQAGNPVPMNTVCVDPHNPQRVFAGSGLFGAPGIAGDLWFSDTGGQTWNRTALTDTIVNAILIDPNNADVMYAGCGYSGGTPTPVFKSADGGVTWAPSSDGISEDSWNAVTDLEFSRDDTDVVYAATLMQGLYASPNSGMDWLNLGTPDSQVYTIGISSLYAGTENGLFQLTGTGVLTGEVYDHSSTAMLDGVLVTTDLGINSRSIDGIYMMVVPAGVYSVYATADNYELATADNIIVGGAAVTRHHFAMNAGSLQTAADNGEGQTVTLGTKSSGGYCFVGAAAEGHFPVYPMLWWLGLSAVVLAIPARRRTAVVFGVLTFLLLVGVTVPALGFTIFDQVGLASAPLPVGSGARAQGMGGAFIAIADDATAASWNPSGLVQLERPELSLVGAWTDRRETYSSDSNPEIDTTGTASHGDINYASATLPFHWHKNMVLSLNYQRLFDFQRTFSYQRAISGPEIDLNQRIHYDQDGSVGAVGLAGALEITPRLSVGATLNIWTDQAGYDNGWNEAYRERATGTQSEVPVTITTTIEERYEQFRGVNFNLGVMYATDHFGTFGAVVKTPFKATIQHRFRLEQTTTYGAPVNDQTVTGPMVVEEEVRLYMPVSYGLGWSRRMDDRFTLAVDIYRTEWDDYTMTNGLGEDFSPIDGRPKGDSDVDATTHFRVGAEYVILNPERHMAFPLRAGLFYDPEPCEDTPVDVYGIALGAGLSLRRCSFDLAYQLRWAENADSGNLISGSRADVTQNTLMASVIYYF
jgi:long-subunit fatty acid transport protein/photosystem II stability/assembly factor-like uncharacterized protein